MNSAAESVPKLTPSSGKIRPFPKKLPKWIGFLCAFALVFGPSKPDAVRSFLITSEPFIVPSLLFGAIFLSAASWIFYCVPRLRLMAARFNIRLSRALCYFGFPLALLLCWIPLWSNWSLRPTSTLSAYAALAGRLPWSDASNYLTGANEVIDEGQIGSWNQRRPLNAVFYATRLRIANFDLKDAVRLQVLFLAFCMYQFARAIGAMYGPLPGIAAFAVTLGFGRTLLATTLSETLGLSLGCLGVALLAPGVYLRKGNLFLFGLFGLSMALNARAGALFLLPCYVLWFAWFYSGKRGNPIKLFIVASFCVVISFAVNLGINSTYGKPGSTLYANFAQTFLALSMNLPSWQEAELTFKDELSGKDEKQRTTLMYELAVKQILSEPSKLGDALLRNVRVVFAFLPDQLLNILRGPPHDERGISSTTEHVGLALVGVGLLWYFFLQRRLDEALFWLITIFSFGLSMVLIFPDGGFRIVAPTIPLFSYLIAQALRTPRKFGRASLDYSGWRRSGYALGAFTVTVLLAPFILTHTITRPEISAQEQRDESLVVVRRSSLLDGIIVSPTPVDSSLVVMTPPQFKKMLDDAGMEERNALYDLPTPFVFTTAYDYRAHFTYMLVTPLEVLNKDGLFLKLRAAELPGCGFTRLAR
jgi:hypothetical protein